MIGCHDESSEPYALWSPSVRLQHFCLIVLITGAVAGIFLQPGMISLYRRAPGIINTEFREWFIDGPKRVEDARYNRELFEQRSRSWEASRKRP